MAISSLGVAKHRRVFLGSFLALAIFTAAVVHQQTFVSAYAPEFFVSTWKTDNVGSSDSTSITLPFRNRNGNFDVDWTCDGTFDDIGVTQTITHDYGMAGTYDICIRGDLPWLYLTGTTDKEKLLDVKQWGSDVTWNSLHASFGGANKMQISATDAPNLTGVSTMAQMLAWTNFNADINHWDVSNITDMTSLFHGNTNFNSPLNNWDVSSVKNMTSMFFGASGFN